MKTHNLKLFLLFLVLLFISQSQKQLVCINGGILIMVRTRLQPFSVKYQCLCPFSYYGETCGFFRGIYCFYSNQQILKYDPEMNPKAKLQFQMECFLKKLINQSSISNDKQINNYLRLPLTSSQVQQLLKSNNYYIDQEYQIIWANTTEILDETGNIIRNGTDNRTDDQILNSYPHYQFNYTDNFYGIPLISTKIIYNLNAIRFIDKDISVSENLQPSFEQSITNQFIGNRTKISGTFQIIVNESWSQFGVVRLQLLSSMYYGDNYDIFQRLGMNSGRWRLYNPKFTHGEIIDVNNYTIPGSFWVLFVFIMLLALITCSRIAVKYYKKWRNKKMTNQLLDQQSEIQNEKQ